MIRIILLLVFLVTSISSVFAEIEVTASVEPSSGDVNTIFRYTINVSYDQSVDVGAPQLSPTSEFIIDSRGKSQSMNIINGDPSQSVTYIYQVQAKRQLTPGEYFLPQGQIEVGGKFYPIESKKIKLEVAPKTSRRGPLDFAQIVDNLAPYEGEQLTYRSELVSSAEISDAVLEETTLPSFFREDFPEHKQVVRRVSNSRIFSVREAIYPNKSGEVEIPERGLSAKVKVQQNSQQRLGQFFDDIFTDVFDEFNFKPVRITAEPIKLNVKPLPQKPAGVTGYVPVGITRIKTHLEKAELRSGESATLEIVVESEGNLKPLEFDFSKILPKGIRFYPEKSESDNTLSGERVVQRKHFEAAIIPEHGGQFEISAPVVNYFDPRLESYQKAVGEKLTIVSSGPAPEKTNEPEIKVTNEPVPTVDEISETEIHSVPSMQLLRFGISRRVFSILFAVLLLSALVKLWSKTDSSPVVTVRDFKKIIGELRSGGWHLGNSLRSELKSSKPAEADAIIELIDRVNFSTPALRESSISALESYLKDLK